MNLFLWTLTSQCCHCTILRETQTISVSRQSWLEQRNLDIVGAICDSTEGEDSTKGLCGSTDSTDWPGRQGKPDTSCENRSALII